MIKCQLCMEFSCFVLFFCLAVIHFHSVTRAENVQNVNLQGFNDSV